MLHSTQEIGEPWVSKKQIDPARKVNLYLLLKNRNRSRQKRHQRRGSLLGVASITAAAILSLVAVALTITAVLTLNTVLRDLPPVDTLPVLSNIEDGELMQPTRLLDRTGRTTLYTYQDLNSDRVFLTIDPDTESHVSPQLIRTVTAALEPDFWTSPGFRLDQWRSDQPGTIAERLVDALLLWNDPPSFTRNLRQRLLAGQAVNQYGRVSVLEWYLNSAWFGRYAYGAEAAARLYLGKSARDLTLAEAALLTPLLNAPALNPLDAPEAALENQRQLLAALRADGVINAEEYQRASAETLKLNTLDENSSPPAPAFVRLVENELGALSASGRLQRGGLTVVTTLDADLQAQLFCTSVAQLQRLQSSQLTGTSASDPGCQAALLLPTQSFSSTGANGVTAAGLVMDPQTGDVLAYLGPVSYSGGLSTDALYQPGSLLTPVVAVGAFSRGYSPASLVWDIPGVASPEKETAAQSAYRGPVNLRTALASDYLNPIASLVDTIGAENIWGFGSTLGIKSLSAAPADVSPLFGGAQTSLLDLGTAYSTLANAGIRSGRRDPLTGSITPRLVVEVITSQDRIFLERSDPDRAVILSDSLAYLVNHVLSDANARSASSGSQDLLNIGQPLAVKTGTVADGSQVWTVGYSPDLLVLTWAGVLSPGSAARGVDTGVAAGTWQALYRYASRASQFSGWVRPAGISEVRVCRPSGMLPGRDCPEVTSDVFLSGNEPTLPDTLYTSVKVNRETGLRATVFTPPDLIEENVFMNVPDFARDWALTSGIPLAPQGYDSIHVNQVDPDVVITTPQLFAAVSGVVTLTGTASGDDFAAYSIQVGEGINPETWLQVKESTPLKVKDGILASWDTSGLDGLYAIRLSVVNVNSLVTSAYTQVTVDNTPPSALLSAPSPGEVLTAPSGRVTLTAAVEDLSGINKVEWWIDGELAETQDAWPFFHHMAPVYGRHEVFVKAWDNAGNLTQSPTILFYIQQ